MAKPCCFLLLLSSARISGSLYGKAAGLLDGSEQLVVQLVIVLVGRNVNPIETVEEGGENLQSWFMTDYLIRDAAVYIQTTGDKRGFLHCFDNEMKMTVPSPGVGFGKVVGVGINLVDGEEPRASSSWNNRTKLLQQTVR